MKLSLIHLAVLLLSSCTIYAQLCSSSNTCSGGKICNGIFCGGCNSDTDCQSAYSTSKPFCIQSFLIKVCVQCKQNADCTSGTCSSGQCQIPTCTAQGCLAASATTPVCASDGTCQSCSADASVCPSKGLVCFSNGSCQECNGNSDCTAASKPPVCSATGTCVECVSTSDCTGTGVTCVSNTCQAPCPSNQACEAASSTTPVCYTDGTCQSCSVDTSVCTNANLVCFSDGSCQECNGNSDCTAASKPPVCSATGTCVECVSTSDCAVGACVSNTCQVACTTYQDCEATSLLLPACISGICESCSADTSVCSNRNLKCASDGSCKQCLGNQDCNTAALSQCDSSGTCSVCSFTSDCSQISGKNKCLTSVGCVECLQASDCGTVYDCTRNRCVASAALNIQISSTSSSLVYQITYPAALVQNVNVAQATAIVLVGVDPTTYTYTLVKVTDVQYEIQFTITKTIQPAQIQLTYTYPYQSQPTWTAAITTKRMQYMSETTQQVGEAMQSIGQAASTTMAASSGSIMILGGNPAILWALINLIQNFYYLIFINVNYPPNVQFFLQIFTLAGFNFIPNPIEWVRPDIEQIVLPTPARFEAYDINGLFLENAGNMLLIWVGVLVIYGFAAICRKFLNRLSGIVTTLSTKLVIWFEWSGVLRAFITSYTELIQAAFLQLRVLTFESELFSASSVIGIMFSAYAVVFPLLTIHIVKKFEHNEKLLSKKFGTLVEEYCPSGKYFNGIFLTKRLFMMIILVFLHNYPYIEIFCLTVLNLLTVYVLIKYKPFQTRFDNNINIASEVLFTVIYIGIAILIHDDYALRFVDETRENIGWLLIGGCGIIVALNIATTVIEQYKALKTFYVLTKKVLNKSNKDRAKRRIHPRARLDYQVETSTLGFSNTINSTSFDGINLNQTVSIKYNDKLHIPTIEMSPALSRNRSFNLDTNY